MTLYPKKPNIWLLRTPNDGLRTPYPHAAVMFYNEVYCDFFVRKESMIIIKGSDRIPIGEDYETYPLATH
jgi:hypothetical protein